MSIYDATGRTREQLLEYGQRHYKEFSFRNEPYHHHVSVVCDVLDFAAMAEYAKVYLGCTEIANYYDRYITSGGLTINWEHMGIQYSVICLHMNTLSHYNHAELVAFLNTLVHEQQHMLVRVELKTLANYIKEDEPRAYSTGWTLEMIIRILHKRWDLALVSMPVWMVPRVRRLDELCNVVGVKISSNTVYSGTLRQYMEGRSDLVLYNNQEQSWHATSYWSGGERVNEEI